MQPQHPMGEENRLHDRREQRYPTSEEFDVVFTAAAQSATLRRIWRDAYGSEYPEEASPTSFVTRTELRHIARTLDVGPGQSFVDLACGLAGPGLWVARATGASVIGVDFSPVAMEFAIRNAHDRGLGAQASFIAADVAATGLPARSVNGAMSIDAFQLFPDPTAVVREVARLLHTGSHFVFTMIEPLGSSRLNDYRRLLEATGFCVDAYEEMHDLEYRMQVVRSILAAREALLAEMGELAERTILAEAEEARHWLPHMRRMRLVASKR